MPRMPDLALDQQRGQPLYLTSPRLTEAGLPHLFTTRHFPGVTSPRDPGSPFGAESLRLLAELDLNGGPPAFLRQVHGADVLAAEQAGLVGRADVVVTDRPGLPLAIFTADCVPPVLYDPVGRRLGAAPWSSPTPGGAERRPRRRVPRRARSSRRAEHPRPSSARSARRSDRVAT